MNSRQSSVSSANNSVDLRSNPNDSMVNGSVSPEDIRQEGRESSSLALEGTSALSRACRAHLSASNLKRKHAEEEEDASGHEQTVKPRVDPGNHARSTEFLIIDSDSDDDIDEQSLYAEFRARRESSDCYVMQARLTKI